MAVIHEGKNSLKQKAQRYKTVSMIFYAIPFIYIIASFLGYHLDGILHIVPFWVAFIGVFLYRKYKILSKGVEGEEAASNILQLLPDQYEVFSSVNLTTSAGTAEYDHIVIGENGVFVVEVKNHNGKIQGNEEDRTWMQHKVGRNGGEYSKEMRNPVKQVRRAVHILSDYLKQNGSRVWVEGVVFFSNPDVSVNVNAERTPVFSSSNDLHYFITNYEPKRKLSPADIDSVKRLIV